MLISISIENNNLIYEFELKNDTCDFHFLQNQIIKNLFDCKIKSLLLMKCYEEIAVETNLSVSSVRRILRRFYRIKEKDLTHT